MKPKRLVVVGGILLALGIYLGTLFQGLGLGVGSLGQGDGPETAVSTRPTSPTLNDLAEHAETEVNSPASQSTAHSPGGALNPTDQRLNVLIDGRDYLLMRSDGTEPRKISLEELVGMLPSATGDRDGVRIRVSRKKSSRATAELALEQALTKAGIPTEAQIWSSADDAN